MILLTILFAGFFLIYYPIALSFTKTPVENNPRKDKGVNKPYLTLVK